MSTPDPPLLTGDRLSSAVAYNRSRHYAAIDWQVYQAALGADPDGIPGPQTAEAVAAWQRAHCLTLDGKLGPATLAVLLQRPPPEAPCRGDRPPEPERYEVDTGDSALAYQPGSTIMPATPSQCAAACDRVGMRISAWLDIAPRWLLDRARADQIVRELHACGISYLAIMTDSATATGRADFKWTIADHIALAQMLEAAGIGHGLCIWPEPRRTWMDSALPHLRRLVGALGDAGCPVGAVEVDVEGNWERRDVVGFASLDDAGAYLAQALLNLEGSPKLESTTFPYHGEYSVGGPTITNRLGTTFPQAYSRHRQGSRPWGGDQGPRRMQRLAEGRVRSALGFGHPMGMGLAAYDQVYPNRPAWHAMGAALHEAAHVRGVTRVCYWSGKWIFGAKRNRYAYDFLRAVQSARASKVTA